LEALTGFFYGFEEAVLVACGAHEHGENFANGFVERAPRECA
jgi:hypothetical protein